MSAPLPRAPPVVYQAPPSSSTTVAAGALQPETPPPVEDEPKKSSTLRIVLLFLALVLLALGIWYFVFRKVPTGSAGGGTDLSTSGPLTQIVWTPNHASYSLTTTNSNYSIIDQLMVINVSGYIGFTSTSGGPDVNGTFQIEFTCAEISGINISVQPIGVFNIGVEVLDRYTPIISSVSGSGSAGTLLVSGSGENWISGNTGPFYMQAFLWLGGDPTSSVGPLTKVTFTNNIGEIDTTTNIPYGYFYTTGDGLIRNIVYFGALTVKAPANYAPPNPNWAYTLDFDQLAQVIDGPGVYLGICQVSCYINNNQFANESWIQTAGTANSITLYVAGFSSPTACTTAFMCGQASFLCHPST